MDQIKYRSTYGTNSSHTSTTTVGPPPSFATLQPRTPFQSPLRPPDQTILSRDNRDTWQFAPHQLIDCSRSSGYINITLMAPIH